MKIPEVLPENCNILYRADCKEAIQNLIDRNIYVDLIYLDPPFNSNQVYNLIYKGKGSKAQQKVFGDIFTYNQETQLMLEGFNNYLVGNREISDVVKNFLKVWIESLSQMSKKDQSMISYLVYMAERLIWCKKILKETGSIYYHCDPTASHYIKIIMDGIFGSENFRNEIVWRYRRWPAKHPNFQRMHDIIFRYSKTKNIVWNQLYEKNSESTIKAFGNARLTTEITEKGTVKKVKTDEISKGTNMSDVWEISIIQGSKSKERLGYNTQKPLKLLDRIIRASTNEGDVVLDPFCGCGTTIEASHKLGRRWIGIDVSLCAIKIIEKDRGFNSIPHERYDGNPETIEEFEALNPFDKQKYLVREVGGFYQKMTGDGGVDGEMTIHLGLDKENKDMWGRMIFSVKTGKQSKPEFIRELLGTMKTRNAVMGGLIIEEDFSSNMGNLAKEQGYLEYSLNPTIPAKKFDRLQILKVEDIIDGLQFNTPYTMEEIRSHRKQPTLQ